MPSFPNATSPRLLTRLIEAVATGRRRTRALTEALGIEPPVLRSYLFAAAWLGLVDLGDDPVLTRLGLRFRFARARRWQVLREALTEHPLTLLLAQSHVETVDLVPLVHDPEHSARTDRRRALELRRLLAPLLRRPPRVATPPLATPEDDVLEPARPPEQLTLGFSSEIAAPPPPLDLRAGADDSPDVYTHILRALLDHGELDPHQVRGLLDACGGADCGIGGYLAMATRRGDATRVGDTLVVTPGAAVRRDLAESPVSVALSDPDFRRHLTELAAGRAGDARRFRPWMARLFQGVPVDEALDRLLFGRRLASFPVAGEPLWPSDPPSADPFLACLEDRSLILAFPSSLALMGGGLSTINQLLRTQRSGAVARAPSALDRRVRVHGGLLHPGEGPLKVIPDFLSLRGRALRNVPAFAILVALGLLDRRGDIRVRAYGQELLVTSGGQRPRRVEAVVDALAAARGWVVARSPTGPSWVLLAELAEQIGLLTSVAPFFTVEEQLFRKLESDPEHRDLMEGLGPLADALAGRLGKR